MPTLKKPRAKSSTPRKTTWNPKDERQLRRASTKVRARLVATGETPIEDEPQGVKLSDKYQVLLVSPKAITNAEHVYDCETREGADAWCESWEREPLGLLSVIVPPNLKDEVARSATTVVDNSPPAEFQDGVVCDGQFPGMYQIVWANEPDEKEDQVAAVFATIEEAAD